jgi:predicted nucleic acid-binding protein
MATPRHENRLADAFYFLAILSPGDQHHARTLRPTHQLRAHFVTTDWVLTEVADALSKGGESRSRAVGLIRHLHGTPGWEVVSFSQALRGKSLDFYGQHADKEWTLTDCTSFVVMQERSITEALTGDRHFEQAGFIALLK